MKIFRIRRYSGFAGGSNFYHHADVIAPDRHAALRAAKEGRVRRWRWIDTFDSTPETYERYEYLYRVFPGERVYPVKPDPKWFSALEQRIKKIKGVDKAVVTRQGAFVYLVPKIKQLTRGEIFDRVRDLLETKPIPRVQFIRSLNPHV